MALARHGRRTAGRMTLLFALAGAPAASQTLDSPPDLRLSTMLDTLLGPDGRVELGDMIYDMRGALRARGALGVGVNLWPGGSIPVVLDRCLSAEQQREAQAAMARWQAVAPVRFSVRVLPPSGPCDVGGAGPGEPNYIRVVADPDRNSSCVGMCGGEQLLRLQPDVLRGVILHELGHALGMGHEHVRSDRDRYLEVRSQNVLNGMLHNFARLETRNCAPYDFGSIMHYGPSFFSGNGQATLVPHEEFADFGALMGRQGDLTPTDSLDANVLYGDVDCDPEAALSAATPSVERRRIDMSRGPLRQRVLIAPEITNDDLRAVWADGMQILTGTQTLSVGTVLVSATRVDFDGQSVARNPGEVPRAFIDERWSQQGLVITGLFPNDAGWGVVMSRAAGGWVPAADTALVNWGWHQQSWSVRTEWSALAEEIDARWTEGYRVTGLAHGRGGWFAALSRDTRWGVQQWVRTDDPGATLREKLDEGFQVTDAAFGEGLWTLVFTRDGPAPRQGWAVSGEVPEATLREWFDVGCVVTVIDQGDDGRWVVACSVPTGRR